MKEHKNENIGFSAFLVGIGTLLSRILGFVRDMLLTAYFSRTVTDAWLVAFRLPNMFRRLLGEGALAVSFIPVFNALLSREKLGGKAADLKPNQFSDAQKLTSAIFTLLLSILIALTCLGIIFIKPIVELLTKGEGYSSIPGKVELTVHLARIMFVYILLVSLYAYFMAILNSLKRFLLPALAPVLWNISMILAALLNFGTLSESGEILAWGVVVGGVLQVGLLVPQLIKEGYFPHLNFDWNTQAVKDVFKGFGPSMIGLGIMQITILVNTYFASYLPEGTNTWIFLADRILELPLSLFAVSLGTALLPTLSQQWHEDRHEEFHKTSNYYLRSVLFLALPAAIGCYMMADEIVHILFQRKNFTAVDAMNTAQVLKVYSVAIVTYSAVRVLAPSFYAIKNTWYPALCSLGGLVVHLCLAWVLIQAFGLEGLIMSTVISASVNMILLFIGYKIFIGPFAYQMLFKSFLKFSIPGGIMFLLLLSVKYLPPNLGLPDLGLYARFTEVFAFLIVIASAAVVYFFVAHLMNLEELKPVSNRIAAKLKRISRS